MKCDVCKKRNFSRDELTCVAQALPIDGDDVWACPTCFMQGVIDGDVTPNPAAFEAHDDDSEGEEWKSQDSGAA